MKLIIHAPEFMPIGRVLHYITHVVADGLVSNNNTQYCYGTRFQGGVTLWSDKTKTGTHVFRVSVTDTPNPGEL